MNRFVNIALMLFAAVAGAHCSSYNTIPLPAGPAPGYSAAAPAIQQVNLASLGNLAGLASSYLSGASHGAAYGGNSASYAPARYIAANVGPTAGAVSSSSHSSAPSAGYSAAPAPGYAAAPAPSYAAAPAPSYAAAPAPSYAAAPAPSYAAAPAPSYAAAPAPISAGYGAAAPKFSVLPAWVTQINPGKNSYKSYQTPIHYSTVALPVVPSGPVAKLYIPEGSSYGGSSYGSAAPSY